MLRITGGLLARNTMLNLISKIIPVLTSAICIPYIIQGLGIERYGLLSLIWAILGYSLVFDLGLGRATTKFVASALGEDDDAAVPRIVWTTLGIQGALGFLGCVVLFAMSRLLAVRALNVPPDLVPEAIAALRLLSVSLPISMMANSVSGVLQAAQRFDLANAVGIPVSILISLSTLSGALLHLQLAHIVGLALIVRLVGLSVSCFFVVRLLPDIRKPAFSLPLFPRLFVFGGWISVSSVLSPILQYLDRLLLASILSMSAVGYYTAPFGVVSKLAIIPASLVVTLFPAFSALDASADRRNLSALYARSVKYVFLIMVPIAIMGILFAAQGLRVWLGNDFVVQSTLATQILTLGIVTNALATIPYTLLQGVGRPDVPAKFHLIETPLYILTAWLLIRRWGITGAAAAWSLRVTVDSLLLFGAARRVCGMKPQFAEGRGNVVAILACVLLALATWGVKTLMGSLPLLAQIAGVAPLFALFAWLIWKKVLDAFDRSTVMKGLRPR